MKKLICFLLVLVFILSLTSCSTQNVEPTATIAPTVEPAVSETPVVSTLPEVAEAKTMGIEPDAWESDLSGSADFMSFYDMMSKLISSVDENALTVWTEKVNKDGFPSRSMRRDDALVMIMEAANALGWTTYNARDYGFCIENEVN